MGVLIVDDALFMRLNMTKILKENDIKVVGDAEDGFDAIKKYKKLQPALVTMDITMPHMDGIRAIEEIMKIDPQAKIIVCSAKGQQTSVMEAMKAGAKGFIVKPFTNERLIEEIQKVLKKK